MTKPRLDLTAAYMRGLHDGYANVEARLIPLMAECKDVPGYVWGRIGEILTAGKDTAQARERDAVRGIARQRIPESSAYGKDANRENRTPPD